MFVVLFLVVGATGAMQPKDEVGPLLDRLETTLSAIQTLRATVVVRKSSDGGSHWRTTQTARLLMSGRNELVDTEFEGFSFRGQWRPEKSHRLDLFEPSGHQSLNLQPPGAAGLDHAPASGPGGWVNPIKAQMMFVCLNDTYRGVYNQSVVRKVKHVGDEVEVHLELKERGLVRAHRWTFSPSRGGLVTRAQMDWVDQDAKGPNKIRTSVREITDFWEPGPGLLIPKTIQAGPLNDPQDLTRIEITDVVCNEPIDPGEFRLPIPSGTIVVDHRRNQYAIWGKDGPERTFETPEAFNTWRTQQNSARFRQKSNTPYWAGGLALLAAVILLALVAHRRRLARAG